MSNFEKNTKSGVMINSGESEDRMDICEPIPPPYGDDLRIDSEDDENLERLPEIERELILSERHETLLKYKEEKALYNRLTGRAPEPEAQKASISRLSKSRKMIKPSPSVSSASSDSSSDSGSEYSSDSSLSTDEADAVHGIAARTSEKEIADSMDVTLTRDLALNIQISRDQLLSAFQDVPTELRDEALLDSFVRVPSGEEGNYLICRVIGVGERSSTKTSESGSFDLILEWPSGDSTSVPVSSVSNTELTDLELANWIGSFGADAGKNMARKAVRKQAQVRQVKEFVWDDRTINRILSKKKSSSVKLTLEVAKLRTALQAELATFNNGSATEEQRTAANDNVLRIKKEIADREAQFRAAQQAFSEANAHQFGIVAINHRNRTEQRLQDVEEAKKRLRSKKVESSSGLNPFKRRECKPVVMWDVGRRSPKKTAQQDPVGLDLVDEPMRLPEADRKQVIISDLISIEKLVSDASAAVSRSGSRLETVRRGMRSHYSPHTAPLWRDQLIGGEQGEIMDFNEWKRRVAEDMVLD